MGLPGMVISGISAVEGAIMYWAVTAFRKPGAIHPDIYASNTTFSKLDLSQREHLLKIAKFLLQCRQQC